MDRSRPRLCKTPALRLHVDNLSKFQQSEKKKHWRPLLGKDNRENYAARSSLVHVFTQAGPIAVARLRSQEHRPMTIPTVRDTRRDRLNLTTRSLVNL